jgi:hypothetical protein
MASESRELRTSMGRFRSRSIRACAGERARGLPGDEFIQTPLETITHAVTVRCPPSALWPWIAQMGAGRAGWYSYDWIDNGRRPSASRIVPELQRLEVGQVFPALPGVTEGFVLLAFEPSRFLVLGWPSLEGPALVTWTFMLESRDRRSTRLIVRVRGSGAYRFHGLPPSVSRRIVPVIHYLMQRKQLLEIAERAESGFSQIVADTVEKVVA